MAEELRGDFRRGKVFFLKNVGRKLVKTSKVKTIIIYGFFGTTMFDFYRFEEVID